MSDKQYDSYMKSCTPILDSFNKAKYEVVRNIISKHLQYIDDLQNEERSNFKEAIFTNMTLFPNKVDEYQRHIKEVKKRFDFQKGVIIQTLDAYYELLYKETKDLDIKLSSHRNEYHNLCRDKINNSICHERACFWVGLAISVILFVGTFFFPLFVDKVLNKIYTLNALIPYGCIALSLCYQILISVFAWQYFPQSYRRIKRFLILRNMIDTDGIVGNINIQRELELIMKS